MGEGSGGGENISAECDVRYKLKTLVKLATSYIKNRQGGSVDRAAYRQT